MWGPGIDSSYSSRNHFDLKASSEVAVIYSLSILALDMPLRRRDLRGRQREQLSASLLPLPTEIHLIILKYLDIPSTFCLQLASRRFYLTLPPIPNCQLTDDIKTAIKRQISHKLCIKCMKSRPVGAFPQLVDTMPEEAVLPNGLKGWFDKVRQARENKQRIGKQDALMKHYGLVYPSLDPSCELPEPGRWSANERAELRWSNGAKHIQSRLPRGGWVGILQKGYHLFEYRGFCGWVCQGHTPVHTQWIFRCECRRCSAVANEGQSICCWCDPADSRYPLLTPGQHERWGGKTYYPLVKDPGRILFRTKVFPYGRETSWVGRRMNTCQRHYTFDKSREYQAWLRREEWRESRKWEEWDLPSWDFIWCDVCGGYTPPPQLPKRRIWNRNKYKSWEGVSKVWGPGRCVPYVSEPSDLECYV